jgi:hypothetical protein
MRQSLSDPVTRRAILVNLAFERYIGIDHYGAQTPKSSLKGSLPRINEFATASGPTEKAKFWWPSPDDREIAPRGARATFRKAFSRAGSEA